MILPLLLWSNECENTVWGTCFNAPKPTLRLGPNGPVLIDPEIGGLIALRFRLILAAIRRTGNFAFILLF
jgi:hypothetical protein